MEEIFGKVGLDRIMFIRVTLSRSHGSTPRESLFEITLKSNEISEVTDITEIRGFRLFEIISEVMSKSTEIN